MTGGEVRGESSVVANEKSGVSRQATTRAGCN